MSSTGQYHLIAEAFSRQSAHYDEDDHSNEILQLMRQQVRHAVEQEIEPGARILELNAGTGLDALYFSKKGYEVTATDLSPGMIEQIKRKIEEHGMDEQLKVVQSGFHELTDKLQGTYDCIFSNMGGLNCEKDLSMVFGKLSELVKPGGKAILVIMPKLCPWEWLSLFKGKWKQAFRRFQKNGSNAHLEGIHFKTYYHNVMDIRRSLPSQWKFISTTGLGACIPQPHSVNFPHRYPRLFRILAYLDRKLRTKFPFDRWADHIIIQLEYKG